MKVRVLGSGAGGGHPQWNCACPQCARARRAGRPTWRTQDSIALSATGVDWYLLNVSPDVRSQILAAPELTPGPGMRETPIRGVLFSSAEIDHTLGLAILREGARLDVYAVPEVARAFPLRSALEPYAGHGWHEIRPGVSFSLGERPDERRGERSGGRAAAAGDRLTVTAIALSGKRPRYAAELETTGDTWVVAYLIEDAGTGGSLVYASNLADWPEALDKAVAGAGCLLVDGTFWTDDEPAQARLGPTSAAAMGHLPVSGRGGTLERLVRVGAEHPGCRRVLTHINNTNPLLDPASPQRAELRAAGVEVAEDGMAFEL